MKPKNLTTRALFKLQRGLTGLGVRIEPFLTVREGQTEVPVPEAPESFRFGFLGIDDVDSLVALEPGTDRGEVSRWLSDGKLCYGVWDEDRLIAKMWCDLDEFNYPPNRRALARDEAYLYAAFTDPEYRGQSLAPLMRARSYDALKANGYCRIYSYTDYFNTAARRFKSKLGALDEALKVHIALFGKSSWTFTLRRYA